MQPIWVRILFSFVYLITQFLSIIDKTKSFPKTILLRIVICRFNFAYRHISDYNYKYHVQESGIGTMVLFVHPHIECNVFQSELFLTIYNI